MTDRHFVALSVAGVTSPIYIDLRVLPSHPPVLSEVVEVINQRLQSEGTALCRV